MKRKIARLLRTFAHWLDPSARRHYRRVIDSGALIGEGIPKGEFLLGLKGNDGLIHTLTCKSFHDIRQPYPENNIQ